jgi:predicted exporter
MGILHLVGLLLTAAVCVDYGVFYMENRGGDDRRTLQAITVSAITTAAAFASLGAAENPALHALAGTVAPGVLAGLLLCPMMLGNRAQVVEMSP